MNAIRADDRERGERVLSGGIVSLQITRSWPDHGELIELEERAAVMYRQVGYDPSDWATGYPEDFARHEASGLLWVATIEHRPVGFAVADLFRDRLHLEELDVDVSHHRRGVGSSLVRAVIDDALERRLRSVTLRTFSTTPWSVGLYEKHGFRVLGDEAVPYYLAPHIDREREMGFPLADRCTMALDLRSDRTKSLP